MNDVSTTNPKAYSASLANVVFVEIFFLNPGSHVDGIFPPRWRRQYQLKTLSSSTSQRLLIVRVTQ